MLLGENALRKDHRTNKRVKTFSSLSSRLRSTEARKETRESERDRSKRLVRFRPKIIVLDGYGENATASNKKKGKKKKKEKDTVVHLPRMLSRIHARCPTSTRLAETSSMKRASLLQPFACFSLAVCRENCLQRDGIVVDPRIFQLYLFEVERP